MIKTRYFDKRLYADALRQLRMPGLAGTVVLLITSMISPVLMLSAQLQAEKLYVFSIMHVDGTHMVTAIAFLAIAPLTTLSIFHFMNKRNASDFYHALPNRRASLFFSLLAAALTWTLAAGLVSNIAVTVFFLIFSKYFVMNITLAVMTTLGVAAASMLVCAAVALAMTVTGTGFTNIVVSGLIIFLPRLILTSFVSVVRSGMGWLVEGLPFLTLAENQYNLVTIVAFNPIVSSIDSSNMTSTLTRGIVYTFLLALVYIAVGGVLFVRRKSETAERSSPNKWLQHVYRLALTFVICLVPCIAMADNIIHNNNYSYNNDAIVVLYIIALITYFLYELITVRKWKALVQAIPALGVLVLFNVAFVAGAKLIYDYQINRIPVADEVKGIRVMMESRVYDTLDYFGAMTTKISLTNTEAISIVCKGLERAVEATKNGEWYSENNNTRVPIVFEQKSGGELYRNVVVTENEYVRLIELLAADEAFRDVFCKLPQIGENGTRVEMNIAGMKDVDIEAVYEQLCREVAEVDANAWVEYVMSYDYVSFTSFYDTRIKSGAMLERSEHVVFNDYSNPSITVYTRVGLETASFSLQIPTLLPKTMDLYYELVNQQERYDKAVEMLREALENKDQYSEVVYTLCAPGVYDVSSSFGTYDDRTAHKGFLWLAERVEESRGQVVDWRKPCGFVQISRSTDDVYECASVYFQLPEGDLPQSVCDLFGIVQDIYYE